jgi:propanol-preferring alcohol dehydrogenase
MKAWVLDEVHGSLREADLPTPVPGPGQVLVKVQAAGLCHSDVGYVDGVIPLLVPLPLVLGHEASGTIVELGPGVEGYSVGEAVAGTPATDDCPGVTRDGAYAQYVLLSASKLVRLPQGMDWGQAAVATDAGITSYTAVAVIGEVKAGDRVGIIGLGGLGMTGAHIAVLRGATVYGVEPRQSVWAEARAKGVSEVYADVSALEGLDLDVIVDFAGFGTTTTGAIHAVRPRGRVVLVGMGRREWTFDAFDLVFRAVELRGATVLGDPAHLQAVLDLIADGLSVRTEIITFADIPDGLERLRRGEVNGRLVALMS